MPKFKFTGATGVTATIDLPDRETADKVATLATRLGTYSVTYQLVLPDKVAIAVYRKDDYQLFSDAKKDGAYSIIGVYPWGRILDTPAMRMVADAAHTAARQIDSNVAIKIVLIDPDSLGFLANINDYI